jgi:hypothetical protein
MTKRFIAICVAVAAALVLFSGCQLWQSKEKVESLVPTYNQEIPENALEGLDTMDDAGLRALEANLQAGGYLPEGVTIPPEQPTVPQPKPLPTGDQIENAEVIKLVKSVQDIIKTRTFYLKGSGNNPISSTGAYAPMVMAVDQDKLAVETETDWLTMMKELAKENGKLDIGQSRIQAAVLQTTFGKKLRMVFLHSGAYMVLPEKKMFTNLSTLAGEDVSNVTNDLVKSLSNSSNAEINSKMKASKVKVDGKEYLCATLPMEQSQQVKYFFLNGELKRMEFVAEDGSISVIEVGAFSGKVDPALFEVTGLKEMNPGELTNLFGSANFVD